MMDLDVDEYPWRDGLLPIELANTRFAQDGHACDGLTTPLQLANWLAVNARHFQAPAPTATEVQVAAFRALRDAVRELLVAAAQPAPPPAPALEVLNECSARAAYFPRLEWLDDGPNLTLVEVAERHTVALAVVARATIALLAGPDRDRIGRCQAPGCVLFFLKEYRRRNWCSAACGNRARVARHYRRHHVPSSTSSFLSPPAAV